MVRRRRPYINIKKEVSCDIPLDDVIALPFDDLKDRFTDYARFKGFDLDNVEINKKGIRGSFTDKSGVSFKITIKPVGDRSRLEGSISKIMESKDDAYIVGKSAEEFTDALFQG